MLVVAVVMEAVVCVVPDVRVVPVVLVVMVDTALHLVIRLSVVRVFLAMAGVVSLRVDFVPSRSGQATAPARQSVSRRCPRTGIGRHVRRTPSRAIIPQRSHRESVHASVVPSVPATCWSLLSPRELTPRAAGGLAAGKQSYSCGGRHV